MKNTIINEVAQLANTDYMAKVAAIRTAGGAVVFTTVKNITYCRVTHNGAVKAGFAICDPADEFNEEIGRTIALYRALEVQVPTAYTRDAHNYVDPCVGCPSYAECFGQTEDPHERHARIVSAAGTDYNNKVEQAIAAGGSVAVQTVDKYTYVAVRNSAGTKVGVAQCSSRDAFVPELGKVIALYRALGLPVPVDYVTTGVRRLEAVVDVKQMGNPVFDGRCVECGAEVDTCIHTVDNDVLEVIMKYGGNLMLIAAELVKANKALRK